MAVIYKIEHVQSRKKYIGKALRAGKRWQEHLRNVKKGKQHPLYNAIRRYGQNAFIFEVLEEVLEEDLNRREVELIHKYGTLWPNGYNLAEGGTGGNTRKGMNEEQKIAYNVKLSKAAKQKSISGIGISAKSERGKHITEVCPEIASKWEVNYRAAVEKTAKRRREGKFTAKEVAGHKKLSELQKGGGNSRAAKIQCVETGQIFGSMSEAVNYYNLNSRTPIQTTLRTGRPSNTEAIKGLTFKYL